MPRARRSGDLTQLDEGIWMHIKHCSPLRYVSAGDRPFIFEPVSVARCRGVRLGRSSAPRKVKHGQKPAERAEALSQH